MTPYAYSISDYDSHEVFPTLEVAIQRVKSQGYSPSALFEECDVIRAHYPDGTTSRADPASFVLIHEVDVTDVAAYIDKLRHDALERDRASDETARLSGRKPIMITGSAPTIYMLDRQRLIDREIRQRRYSWKL